MTETTVDFTLTDVVREVRALANQNPGFVYSSPGYSESNNSNGTCYYLHGENRDEPGCIVGQALGRLGFTVPVDWEGVNAGEVLGRLFGFKWDLGSDTEVDIVPTEVRWVKAVQAHQDERATWGTAVSKADSAFPLTVNA